MPEFLSCYRLWRWRSFCLPVISTMRYGFAFSFYTMYLQHILNWIYANLLRNLCTGCPVMGEKRKTGISKCCGRDLLRISHGQGSSLEKWRTWTPFLKAQCWMRVHPDVKRLEVRLGHRIQHHDRTTFATDSILGLHLKQIAESIMRIPCL